MNILCVDDEQFALDILVEAVQEAMPDAIVLPFLEVEPLLEFARKNPCDVAFLDIQLRELNGLVLAKRLKESIPRSISCLSPGITNIQVMQYICGHQAM